MSPSPYFSILFCALVSTLGGLPWAQADSFCFGICLRSNSNYIDLSRWKSAPELEPMTRTLTIKRISQPSIRVDLQNQYLLIQKIGSTLRYSQIFYACPPPPSTGAAYLVMTQLGVLDFSMMRTEFSFLWGMNTNVVANLIPTIFQQIGYAAPHSLCDETFKEQVATLSYQNLLHSPVTTFGVTISAGNDNFFIRFNSVP